MSMSMYIDQAEDVSKFLALKTKFKIHNFLQFGLNKKSIFASPGTES